jgi:TonB-dependent SusC/RagA subfamily outer membrane receptor
MKTKPFFALLILLLFSYGYGQTKLKGKVVTAQKEPVAKAKVYLDSIYSQIKTNKDGDFEIVVPETVTVINIYSEKYGLLSGNYNKESVMNFMFLETKKAANASATKGEVALVYSDEKKEYQVATATTLKTAGDNNATVYRSIYDLLRGRLPGVSVSRDNKITIRGSSSIKNKSEPLFVVDGMIVSSIDYIVPMNVKDVKVLKDGEASIYGSQASSGVILITTKRE